MLIRAVLAFSLIETLALTAVLLAWADKVAGARLLAAFLFGFALWLTGNELPNWFGPETERLALHLMSVGPLLSAFFFHFCVVFCGVPLRRAWVVAAYALGGLATLAAEIWVPGYIAPQRDIGWVTLPNAIGVAASAAWVVLGIAGVSLLLHTLLRARRLAPSQKFHQIAAVTASCLWGLVCLTGYGIGVLNLALYPFPLLGLPLYPLILVYGILRYGVFVSNAWARRALVWTLLLALGAVIVALMPLLPFESRWLGGLVVAASCLALNGPVRRFAERLIYPGGEVSVADLNHWRSALQAAETPQALEQQAAHLLGARIGTSVQVRVEEAGAPSALNATDSTPHMVCARGPLGWNITLHGWDAAPPGPRQVAELFGTVVAEAAARVEQAQQLASRERERQLQARLAELGALAATVAHDIRNPLNIISMAVTQAPHDTRKEVAGQVARIAHLTQDLLDYAKPWKLTRTTFDVSALVRSLAAPLPSVTLGPGLTQTLWINADAQRLEQALINLLENTRSALDHGSTDSATADPSSASTARHSHVHLDAEVIDSSVLLHVCDDGPGVPEEIRQRLFEPFASRSPGGTGLGLAIVARIMAAHGGSAALTQRPPWSTCFTLTLPLHHE